MSKTPDIRPSTEDLLGYLLGALEAREHERVSAYVGRNPEIQGELRRLRTCLAPLDLANIPAEPPGGLARRTCLRVFAQNEPGPSEQVQPRPPQAGEVYARDGWQIWDLTMLMSVAILLAMLVTPAIYHSRESARRMACASNLRQLSYSLRSHSDLHGGRLPLVPTNGPAGVAGAFSLELKNTSLLPFDHWVLCPSTDSAAFDNPFVIPSLEKLMSLEGKELRNAQRQLGGSYGYHIGELIRGMLVAAHDLGRNDFAVMSDAPEHERGLGLVACHPQNGRNVLFESGRVCFVMPIRELPTGSDDLFHNRFCRLAPGADCNDSVLVESGILIAPLLMLTSDAE